jgi:hypothetical protein
MAIKILRLDGEVYNLTTGDGGSINKIVPIYETLTDGDDLTQLTIILTSEQTEEIRNDIEHTILKLYNANSSGLREVYFYYVEQKYGSTYYQTVSQGKSYVLFTPMSTGISNTVTISELTSGVTEEQVQEMIDNSIGTLLQGDY